MVCFSYLYPFYQCGQCFTFWQEDRPERWMMQHCHHTAYGYTDKHQINCSEFIFCCFQSELTPYFLFVLPLFSPSLVTQSPQTFFTFFKREKDSFGGSVQSGIHFLTMVSCSGLVRKWDREGVREGRRSFSKVAPVTTLPRGPHSMRNEVFEEQKPQTKKMRKC